MSTSALVVHARTVGHAMILQHKMRLQMAAGLISFRLGQIRMGVSVQTVGMGRHAKQILTSAQATRAKTAPRAATVQRRAQLVLMPSCAFAGQGSMALDARKTGTSAQVLRAITVAHAK